MTQRALMDKPEIRTLQLVCMPEAVCTHCGLHFWPTDPLPV